jgi:uncharacterized membrane protein
LHGFLAYATHEFTNLAILKDRPVTIVIDLAWGMVLGGIASAAGFCAATKFA